MDSTCLTPIPLVKLKLLYSLLKNHVKSLFLMKQDLSGSIANLFQRSRDNKGKCRSFIVFAVDINLPAMSFYNVSCDG